MRVREGLGQIRMTGDVCDEYSLKSMRPYPYRSEDDLIERKEVENLNPTWSDEVYEQEWAPYKKAPPIPSLEREVYPIRSGMSRLRWNKAGPWNLNTKPIQEGLTGLGQGGVFLLGERPPAALLLALSALGIFATVGIWRASDKESSIVWKIALGSGIFFTAGSALGLLGVLLRVE